MPFRSEAQRRYLWARQPKVARKWAKEYPGQKDLPEKVNASGRAGAKKASRKTARHSGTRRRRLIT
ncbi:MAG: hypothetical protein JNN04_11175 [Cyclobacteriaceae bacterium]|nr:hypothetical protein [Cyclobacteriaceae bacterium]